MLRCARSGLIVLDRSDHMDLHHYQEQDGFSYWGVNQREKALERTRRDDARRVAQFRFLLEGKRCMDVGSGPGGFLDLAAPYVDSLCAVEPQTDVRRVLHKRGYEVYPSVEHVSQTGLDVVTVFHVLEHMTTPIDTLTHIRRRLRPRGVVIVEVPHALDYLLSHLDCEPFNPTHPSNAASVPRACRFFAHHHLRVPALPFNQSSTLDSMRQARWS